jgi:hypothetical protein
MICQKDRAKYISSLSASASAIDQPPTAIIAASDDGIAALDGTSAVRWTTNLPTVFSHTRDRFRIANLAVCEWAPLVAVATTEGLVFVFNTMNGELVGRVGTNDPRPEMAWLYPDSKPLLILFTTRLQQAFEIVGHDWQIGDPSVPTSASWRIVTGSEAERIALEEKKQAEAWMAKRRAEQK